jgi:hypothetical protein
MYLYLLFSYILKQWGYHRYHRQKSKKCLQHKRFCKTYGPAYGG